jgi:hypothetical protein
MPPRMRAKRSTTAFVGALVLGVSAAGCGGGGSGIGGPNAKNYSGEEKNAAQVVDDLVTAAHANKPQDICTKIFTPGLAAAITARNRRPCAQTVAKQLVSPKEQITVTQLHLSGDQGTATVREQNQNLSQLQLLKQNGAWRINGVH